MKIEIATNISGELEKRVIDGKSCPLCSLTMEYEFSLLSQIQFKITNDVEFRRSVAGEGGFCDFHFRQFKKIANGKTNILFLKSIIEEGSFKRKDFTINCFICKKVDAYEDDVVNRLVDFLCIENNRKKFEESNGICFTHLKMTDEIIAQEIIKEWLKQTHMVQIERMQSDFENMSRFRSFYEIDREKRRLINILIEKLAGRKTGAL